MTIYLVARICVGFVWSHHIAGVVAGDGAGVVADVVADVGCCS